MKKITLTTLVAILGCIFLVGCSNNYNTPKEIQKLTLESWKKLSYEQQIEVFTCIKYDKVSPKQEMQKAFEHLLLQGIGDNNLDRTSVEYYDALLSSLRANQKNWDVKDSDIKNAELERKGAIQRAELEKKRKSYEAWVKTAPAKEVFTKLADKDYITANLSDYFTFKYTLLKDGKLAWIAELSSSIKRNEQLKNKVINAFVNTGFLVDTKDGYALSNTAADKLELTNPYSPLVPDQSIESTFKAYTIKVNDISDFTSSGDYSKFTASIKFSPEEWVKKLGEYGLLNDNTFNRYGSSFEFKDTNPFAEKSFWGSDGYAGLRDKKVFLQNWTDTLELLSKNVRFSVSMDSNKVKSIKLTSTRFADEKIKAPEINEISSTSSVYKEQESLNGGKPAMEINGTFLYKSGDYPKGDIIDYKDLAEAKDLPKLEKIDNKTFVYTIGKFRVEEVISSNSFACSHVSSTLSTNSLKKAVIGSNNIFIINFPYNVPFLKPGTEFGLEKSNEDFFRILRKDNIEGKNVYQLYYQGLLKLGTAYYPNKDYVADKMKNQFIGKKADSRATTTLQATSKTVGNVADTASKVLSIFK